LNERVEDAECSKPMETPSIGAAPALPRRRPGAGRIYAVEDWKALSRRPGILPWLHVVEFPSRVTRAKPLGFPTVVSSSLLVLFEL
jgi:hypothetical protein